MYLNFNLTMEETLKAGENEVVSQDIVELVGKVEEHLKDRVEESLTSLGEIGDVRIRKFAEESREELLHLKTRDPRRGKLIGK
ncbi:Hypothetical protein FKW44_009599 [Caligus rogercresseyi]|uniref:Uncharacterized protein n=1 Tax=Caligus rogercresseyi TaxID=217165 RepID=A0A7T8K8Z4_CALRO|nr:Hypothetical protein FKW44_009599 [Caligus rogercresseyi]